MCRHGAVCVLKHSSAHRELSVALIKCQGSVYRGCANLLARAAGRPVLPGAEVPYVD